MVIPENYQDVSNGTVYCEAAFNAEYLVKSADDYFYNFAGRQVGISIANMIEESYLEEFTSNVDKIPMGSHVRFILPLLGGDDLYHLSDVFVFNNGKKIGGQPVKEARIYCVLSMERRYVPIWNNSNKYRTLLSMYKDYLFDYDMETDIFTIFSYDSCKPCIFIKDTFEQVRRKLVSYIDEPESVDALNDFMLKVRDGNEGFSVEFAGPSMQDINHLVQYHITTHIHYKHNRQKIVVGVIRINDVESQLSYYELPEGRDPFTGVLNKKACQAYVQEILKKDPQSKHYMVMMDLDNFKSINDNFGHLYGDKVIMKMASIVNSAVSGRGVVGRFGGDEFFIFTNGIDDELNIRSILTHLRGMLRTEFEREFGSNGLTASMGISLYPDDGDNYSELFKKADHCLYIAKEKGKNRFIIYDPAKHGEVDGDDTKLSIGSGMGGSNCHEMAKCIGDIALELSGKEKDDIPGMLGKIRAAFEIDGIRIYLKSSGLFASIGDYRDISGLDKVSFDETMDKLYEMKGFTQISLISNMEAISKDDAKAYNDAGVGGFYSCKLETASGDEARFFFDNIGKRVSYSETQKDIMLLLSKVISGKL